MHIVQRGINRNPCFFENADYDAYLRLLRMFSAECACAVHAYCLMTNHVHLLVTPGSADACAMLMKNLGQCYVQWLNHRLGRSGTLWEGRFKSCMVPTDAYVLACYRYIELNPVRAAIVATPGEYQWSSYALNAHGSPTGWLCPHPAYEALGSEVEPRRLAYREICKSAPPPSFVEDIRKATRIGCVAGKMRKSRGRPVSVK